MKPVLDAFGMISHWIPDEPIEITKIEIKDEPKQVVKPARRKGVK